MFFILETCNRPLFVNVLEFFSRRAYKKRRCSSTSPFRGEDLPRSFAFFRIKAGRCDQEGVTLQTSRFRVTSSSPMRMASAPQTPPGNQTHRRTTMFGEEFEPF